MKTLLSLVLSTFLLLLAVVESRREVLTYEINLDLPPSQRYIHLMDNSKNKFNETVWSFYQKYFENDKILTNILYKISDKRGLEPTEMQEEIQAFSDLSRLPLKFVQSIQLLYELQTFMVPIVNLTKHSNVPKWMGRTFPTGYEALGRIPWRGPGCTGIIAQNVQDGTVWHARNLDFAPVPFMTHLVYNGIFQKNGKEIYRAQMIAGYFFVFFYKFFFSSYQYVFADIYCELFIYDNIYQTNYFCFFFFKVTRKRSQEFVKERMDGH